MDRTIVIGLDAPIPRGHRIEVVERLDEAGERAVLAVTDLETRVRYQQGVGGGSTWTGRVLECTIGGTPDGGNTTLLVDPEECATGERAAGACVAGGGGAATAGAVTAGAVDADIALHGADAAASAVTVEALRWGGADRKPEPEQPRFW